MPGYIIIIREIISLLFRGPMARCRSKYQCLLRLADSCLYPVFTFTSYRQQGGLWERTAKERCYTYHFQASIAQCPQSLHDGQGNACGQLGCAGPRHIPDTIALLELA